MSVDCTKEDLEWAEKLCDGNKLLPREESERSEEMKLMTRGCLFTPGAPELCEARKACRLLLYAFNNLPPGEDGKRRAILKTLFADCSGFIYAEPNLRMDYGRNTSFGKGCYMNYDCVILDAARVTIGDNFLAAPCVNIYAVTHPTDPTLRCFSGREVGFPVTIGNNVWLGGRSVICPGVTIGDNVVVGAGTVVVHDIPFNSIVAGNPARIVKTVTPPAAGVVHGFLRGPQPFAYDINGRIVPPIDPNSVKKEEAEEKK